MKNLEIYDELMAKAKEIDSKAWHLESKADKMHETAKILRELVGGSVGFIVDEHGNAVDTASVIPEITIRPAKRGGGYVVDFGEFGGAFRGVIGELAGNSALHDAIETIAKVIYGKAKAYANNMERSDAEEASAKVEAEACA